MRSIGRSLPAVAALLLGACATAGSTLGSGVGDRLVRDPPYAAGRVVDPADFAGLVHLPVAYQAGGAQDPIFDPSPAPGSQVALLLDEINAYLDSLGVSVPVRSAAPAGAMPPDVRFSCEADAFGDCASEGRDVAELQRPWMRLDVRRPSASWVDWLRDRPEAASAGAALVITLEVGQYWTHQRNLRGDKEVRLGTGYTVELPWLTSLERPVQVLQLTGALVDPQGRAIRVAAEGLLARRTNLLLASLGARQVVTQDDVGRVRGLRRDDLAGRPLVWQAALRSLLGELTRESALGMAR